MGKRKKLDDGPLFEQLGAGGKSGWKTLGARLDENTSRQLEEIRRYLSVPLADREILVTHAIRYAILKTHQWLMDAGEIVGPKS